MYKTSIEQIARTVAAAIFLVSIVPNPAAYGLSGSKSKSAADTPQTSLEQVLDLNKQLIASENAKDFDTVKAMVWESPSALFVAKTATAAEGNWAGFWGHDVVVQHLHDVIYGGPFHIDPDYTKAKVVLLNAGVAETYVPVHITVGYGGQQPVPKPFLILIDWVKTPAGWKMASDIAIPVPPPPAR
ncbi:hypothetical protein RBB77_13195 [Tunturibacter psychrotolerans]|uniref:Nuclear transport factor 2 family protein n=1 Tax=Tunturiibacter psychrotolerans TaxID=3069686 RepID=A0AAU7ZKS3_9BACT